MLYFPNHSRYEEARDHWSHIEDAPVILLQKYVEFPDQFFPFSISYYTQLDRYGFISFLFRPSEVEEYLDLSDQRQDMDQSPFSKLQTEPLEERHLQEEVQNEVGQEIQSSQDVEGLESSEMENSKKSSGRLVVSIKDMILGSQGSFIEDGNRDIVLLGSEQDDGDSRVGESVISGSENKR